MSLVNYILQTASVTLLYVVGFLGAMNILGLVTLYQLFFYTPLWPLVPLYLSWTFLVEWKTPERGGRDLLRNFARRFFLFKYIRDYYPITLIKTSELDPQKNYILGYHPHGILTEGASMALGTEACGFSEKFPGIIPHLSVHYGKKTRLGYDILMLSLQCCRSIALWFVLQFITNAKHPYNRYLTILFLLFFYIFLFFV